MLSMGIFYLALIYTNTSITFTLIYRASMSTSPAFQVEKIIGRKVFSGKVLYLVKWVGFPVEQATWETIKILKNVKHLIKSYTIECKEAGRTSDAIQSDQVDEEKTLKNQIIDKPRKRRGRSSRSPMHQSNQLLNHLKQEECKEPIFQSESSKTQQATKELALTPTKQQTKSHPITQSFSISITRTGTQFQNINRAEPFRVIPVNRKIKPDVIQIDDSDSNKSNQGKHQDHKKHDTDNNIKTMQNSNGIKIGGKEQEQQFQKQVLKPLLPQSFPSFEVNPQYEHTNTNSTPTFIPTASLTHIYFLQHLQEQNKYLIEYSDGVLKKIQSKELMKLHPIEFVSFLEGKLKEKLTQAKDSFKLEYT